MLGAYVAVHYGVYWAFPVTILSGAAMGLINGLLVFGVDKLTEAAGVLDKLAAEAGGSGA